MQGGGGDSQKRLVYLTTCLEGHNVEVQVFGGSVFSGIFHECDTEKKFGITMKMARCLMKDSSAIVTESPTETMFISAKNLQQIIAKDVPLTRSRLVDEVQSDKELELWIDPSISKSCLVDSGKDLDRRTLDIDDTESCPESDTNDKYWIRGWDQYNSDGPLFEYDINDIEEVVVTKTYLGLEMKKLERETTSDPHLTEAPPSSSASDNVLTDFAIISMGRQSTLDPNAPPPQVPPSSSVLDDVLTDLAVISIGRQSTLDPNAPPPQLPEGVQSSISNVITHPQPPMLPSRSAPSTSEFRGGQADSVAMPPSSSFGLLSPDQSTVNPDAQLPEGAESSISTVITQPCPPVLPSRSAPSNSEFRGGQADSGAKTPSDQSTLNPNAQVPPSSSALDDVLTDFAIISMGRQSTLDPNVPPPQVPPSSSVLDDVRTDLAIISMGRQSTLDPNTPLPQVPPSSCDPHLAELSEETQSAKSDGSSSSGNSNTGCGVPVGYILKSSTASEINGVPTNTLILFPSSPDRSTHNLNADLPEGAQSSISNVIIHQRPTGSDVISGDESTLNPNAQLSAGTKSAQPDGSSNSSNSNRMLVVPVTGYMLVAPTGNSANILILFTPSSMSMPSSETSTLNPNANLSVGTESAKPDGSSNSSNSNTPLVVPVTGYMLIAPTGSSANTLVLFTPSSTSTMSSEKSTLNPNAELSVGTNSSMSSQVAPQTVISQPPPSISMSMGSLLPNPSALNFSAQPPPGSDGISHAPPTRFAPSTSEFRGVQADSGVTPPLTPLVVRVIGFMLMAPTGSCVNTLILFTPSSTSMSSSEGSTLNPNAKQSEGTQSPKYDANSQALPNGSAQPSTSEFRGVQTDSRLSVGTDSSMSSQVAPQPVISQVPLSISMSMGSLFPNPSALNPNAQQPQAPPSSSALDDAIMSMGCQLTLDPNAPSPQQSQLNTNAMPYDTGYGPVYYQDDGVVYFSYIQPYPRRR